MSQAGAGIDFARLYAELGVAPDGGLEAFRQAYRRRVAELHPDRPASAPRDPSLLIALNLGYAAVLDFHRAQGRIPGQPLARADDGAQAATHAPAAGAVRPVPDADALRTIPPQRRPAAARSAPRIRVLLVPVLLAIAAIWRWLPEAGPPPGGADAAHSAPEPPPAATRGRVQLGMDRDTVAMLIGEPVARDADNLRWIYGPSWLQFECGRLVDWYSSPLHPLRVGSRRPTPLDIERRIPVGTPCLEPSGPLATRHHGAS